MPEPLALSSGNALPPAGAGLWSRLCREFARLLASVSFRRRVPALRLEESLALGERRSLLVVQWEDRRYLLGVTPQSVRLLDSRGEAGCENPPAGRRA